MDGRTLGRMVFSVDGDEYRWQDVLLAAQDWGDWAPLEHRAAEGLACLRRAASEGDPLADDDVRSAARAFRYERGLLSGEEMEQWLARWSMDLRSWMGSIRRSLLRDLWAAEIGAVTSGFPVPPDEVREAAWVDAICSGAMGRLARALAARAATHRALNGSAAVDPAGASRTAQLDASFDRYREQAVTPGALEQLISVREMDWMRVTYRALALPDAGMAREAALCVRHDGTPLAEVAGYSGAAVEETRVFLEDVEPPLTDMLVSAEEGELLGPLPAEDGFVLLAVEAKARPSLGDPALRERAEREVVRRAVEQEVVTRVSWHEPV